MIETGLQTLRARDAIIGGTVLGAAAWSAYATTELVFASLLFCLFAVLAAARLRETPPAPVANDPNLKIYSEQQLSAVVAQRVHDELQRIKNPSVPEAPPTIVAKGPANRITRGRPANRITQVASTDSHLKARRPLSKVERQQLAADLRLIAAPTEGDLDLLDDRSNR